jgi:hypothetical protein
VYRNGPPTIVIAFVLALVAGTVLALRHWIGGAVLVVFALLLAWARDRAANDGEDHSGLY